MKTITIVKIVRIEEKLTKLLMKNVNMKHLYAFLSEFFFFLIGLCSLMRRIPSKAKK